MTHHTSLANGQIRVGLQNPVTQQMVRRCGGMPLFPDAYDSTNNDSDYRNRCHHGSAVSIR